MHYPLPSVVNAKDNRTDYKPRLNQSDISTEHERNIIHFIIFQTIFSFLVLLTILWFDFKDHHIVGFWFHIATPWNWWHSKHCIFLRQFLLTLVDITKFLIWVLTNHCQNAQQNIILICTQFKLSKHTLPSCNDYSHSL